MKLLFENWQTYLNEQAETGREEEYYDEGGEGYEPTGKEAEVPIKQTTSKPKKEWWDYLADWWSESGKHPHPQARQQALARAGSSGFTTLRGGEVPDVIVQDLKTPAPYHFKKPYRDSEAIFRDEVPAGGQYSFPSGFEPKSPTELKAYVAAMQMAKKSQEPIDNDAFLSMYLDMLEHPEQMAYFLMPASGVPALGAGPRIPGGIDPTRWTKSGGRWGLQLGPKDKPFYPRPKLKSKLPLSPEELAQGVKLNLGRQLKSEGPKLSTWQDLMPEIISKGTFKEIKPLVNPHRRGGMPYVGQVDPYVKRYFPWVQGEHPLTGRVYGPKHTSALDTLPEILENIVVPGGKGGATTLGFQLERLLDAAGKLNPSPSPYPLLSAKPSPGLAATWPPKKFALADMPRDMIEAMDQIRQVAMLEVIKTLGGRPLTSYELAWLDKSFQRYLNPLIPARLIRGGKYAGTGAGVIPLKTAQEIYQRLGRIAVIDNKLPIFHPAPEIKELMKIDMGKWYTDYAKFHLNMAKEYRDLGYKVHGIPYELLHPSLQHKLQWKPPVSP